MWFTQLWEGLAFLMSETGFSQPLDNTREAANQGCDRGFVLSPQAAELERLLTFSMIFWHPRTQNQSLPQFYVWIRVLVFSSILVGSQLVLALFVPQRGVWCDREHQYLPRGFLLPTSSWNSLAARSPVTTECSYWMSDVIMWYALLTGFMFY